MAKKAVLKNIKRTPRRQYEDLPSMESESESGSESNVGSRRSMRESSESSTDYKSMLREFASNPAVRYVAGGIATAVLSKLATNLSARYPEISNFIKENLDNVEGRLGDFRNSLNDSSARQH